MKKKNIIILIFLSVFISLFAGHILNAPVASAGFFQDLWNRFNTSILGVPQNPNSDILGVPPNPNPDILGVPPNPNPEPPAGKKDQTPSYNSKIDYEQSVINAVAASDKSVVSIIISKNLPIIKQCPYDPYADLPPELRQFFGSGIEFYQPCQKGTEIRKVGGGSGFIVSSDGLILTNKHVVSDESAAYTVLTNDGKTHDAKVLARDPVQDIAIIKINALNLTPAKLGDSDSVKLGQTAIVIGNSLGEFSNTVSVGVVSGLSRTITASGEGIGQETIRGVIQTDAAINPGNSGGPLLNLAGEVIGINTAIVSGAQSIGFAIPINKAKRGIESVKNFGDIKVPYLGVRFKNVTLEMAKEENLPAEKGALIRGDNEGPGVMPDSPAMKAGLLAEDIILEINNEKISADKPLNSLIQKYNIGDTINLKIQRGGKALYLKALLEERPVM